MVLVIVVVVVVVVVIALPANVAAVVEPVMPTHSQLAPDSGGG